MPANLSPSALCGQAIVATEATARLPPQLLGAIALIESSRRDVSGVARPWPWTIDAEGAGYYFDTKNQAVEAVQALQARGVRSIDVGCMQINLMYHADAFVSLDQAFDPRANVIYAAHFLKVLFAQTGTWPKAAAAYHSQTPDIGADYLRRVMAIWPLASRFVEHAEPEEPLIHTAEFAQRLARDEADRRALYAEMRMPAAPARKGHGPGTHEMSAHPRAAPAMASTRRLQQETLSLIHI